MVDDTHRRKRIQFWVLQSLDMDECEDVKNLANIATILFQDLGTETDKLFILGKVNSMPSRTNKVLEPGFRNTHAGEAVLAVKEGGDEGADLGEIERVVRVVEQIHLHDES